MCNIANKSKLSGMHIDQTDKQLLFLLAICLSVTLGLFYASLGEDRNNRDP